MSEYEKEKQFTQRDDFVEPSDDGFDPKLAADFLREKMEKLPEVAVILGSGLSDLAEEMELIWQMPYEDIPSFPKANAPGHKARLLYGKIEERYALFFQGRFHYYEGHSIQTTVFPVRLAAYLGIQNLFLTNAAGGLQEHLAVGSLVLIKDHLSFFLPSPLRGENLEDLGPRFPDMTEIYSRKLRDLAKEKADALGIELHEGIYAYMPGPQYESPSEIKVLQQLAVDLVGMSTVAEAIAGKHAGMQIIGISTVTNLAAGLGGGDLHHEEVLEVGKKSSQMAKALVREIIKDLPSQTLTNMNCD